MRQSFHPGCTLASQMTHANSYHTQHVFMYSCASIFSLQGGKATKQRWNAGTYVMEPDLEISKLWDCISHIVSSAQSCLTAKSMIGAYSTANE